MHSSEADVSGGAQPTRRGPAKKRGNYNCGRCGLPKKGHVCPSSPPPALPPRSDHRLRRALSFDEEIAAVTTPQPEAAGMAFAAEDDEEEMVDVGGGFALPESCLARVFRRLSPKELMGSALVCRGWRECVRRVWITAEEIRVRVSQVRFVGSVLHKCVNLARLSLIMESDADSTVLACVAFSCPNLEYLEISLAKNAVNRITGDELGRFVAERRNLSVLKVAGCTNLGFLNISSSSLSTLWLSDLYCVSRVVLHCPNLKELSLDFIPKANDSTDLVNMMDSLGRGCQSLRKIHIASALLCNDSVRALSDANIRGLRMLSLILGSRITDASVAAIIACYTNLELLDLSGSSISDNGVGMICNALPRTLSRLLLAVCPTLTSSGIQFATAQLPLLTLLDCGMSICDSSYDDQDPQDGMIKIDEKDLESRRCRSLLAKKSNSMHQKLLIKHERLKKLSLWGCSGLDALYLNCPELVDLNLNSCTNLHPERLLLQCPNLRNVHASGCQDMLIGAVRNQVLNEFTAVENQFSLKRLADGSKRVQLPRFLPQALYEDEKRKKIRPSQCMLHLNEKL
ncbi:F-box/LRR-repeat protein 17 [Phalaenopsis equestris]|uniref:F-box/LRR-repeat protein 17 n=1 Tax=Phalaenopsis equestris TaxID=78828 RepID=UPI0009E37E63|nr:F-box/LRR-repeat protein 17 [Phalaenopsis equestris]